MASGSVANHENVMCMPVVPASPKNRAYSDHPKAARTPTLTRVSMVAAPWRALTHAARWNGSAPQTATGAASVRASHCQFGNCRTGTIESTTTGTASTADTTRRRRSGPVGSSSSAGSASAAAGGAGTVAPYPADSTAAMSASGSAVPSAATCTCAFSVA